MLYYNSLCDKLLLCNIQKGGGAMLEIFSTVIMGGIVGYSFMKKNGITNDADKINKIARNCNLMVREKNGEKTEIKTIHLYRRKRHEWGMEYVYKIPLGLSVNDFQNKLPQFQDGLNNKRLNLEITKEDIKRIMQSKEVLKELKKTLQPQSTQKEIELSYDGMLHVKVFNYPLEKEYHFEQDLLEKCKGWEIPIGLSRKGLIKHNFEKRSHMIIAGATGFGKSKFIKLLVTVLLHNKPKETRFYLIDLKGGLELSKFKNLQQTVGFAKNPSEAYSLLLQIQKDMNEKLDLLFEKGFEDIKEAGEKERYFVVIDEAADIADNKNCVEIITDISRRGRAAGYRLIYATQYPTNETLPSQVRANIGARVCFRLETNIQSRAVLDEGGAEELPEIEGRAIFRRVSNTIVQTPYIQNKMIDDLIKPHIRGDKVVRRETTRRNLADLETD